jgi:hypothetical protein
VYVWCLQEVGLCHQKLGVWGGHWEECVAVHPTQLFTKLCWLSGQLLS